MTPLSILLLTFLPALASTEPVATPYARLSEGVLRLYQFSEQGGDLQPLRPVGTGFLVRHSDHIYLVSAGHVSRLGDLYARIPTPNHGVRELLIPRGAWVTHPSWSTPAIPTYRLPGAPPPPPAIKPTDVAVARVPLPPDFPLQAFSLSGGVDPQPADDIMVAGYPKDFLADAHVQRPLLRKGIVAMHAAEPVIPAAGERALLDARVIVLDVLTFGGNSGSPVFAAPGFPNSRVVVGLVSSGDPQMALAFAEPVSRILETIEHAGSATAVLTQWRP
jgi:hypothetical protein